MDFNLIDSSFHTKIPPHKPLFHKLHRIPDVLRFPEPSDSSNFQLFRSLSPPPPPPPHCNYSFAITPTNSFPVESKFPNLNNFPVLRRDSMEAMRETIFRMAVMQPIQIDPETVKPPARKNVRISKDPQSVAARHRRERISQRIRILQRMVPGGTKLDTASMLDEAVHYLKFLKKQVQSLERAATAGNLAGDITAGFLPAAGSVNGYLRFD